jgi:predicted enzyme related to lactoylglutathione lyase
MVFEATHLACVVYPVVDVHRARGFYEGVLKLKQVSLLEQSPGCFWIEYDIGGSVLAITNINSGQWVPTSQGATAAISVSHFNDAIAVLRDAGTGFLIQPTETQSYFMTVVLDSEGNGLIIRQDKEL